MADADGGPRDERLEGMAATLGFDATTDVRRWEHYCFVRAVQPHGPVVFTLDDGTRAVLRTIR